MKKIALICFLVIVPFIVFADGKVTGVDGSVDILTLKNGSVDLSLGKESVNLLPEQKNKLIDNLKLHLDLLSALSSEKIIIESTRYSGIMNPNYSDSIGFWVYINAVKDNAYIVSLRLNGKSSNTISFNSSQLSTLISELEKTRDYSDAHAVQTKRVDELMEKIQKNFKK